MEQVLQRRIEIIDNLYIIKILKADDLNGKGPDEEENVGQGEAKGALGIRIETKEIMVFECKSLILATGGYTRVYSVSSSRISENYGEGIALAYEAGADLVDMEMVQFHPTGMVWPETALGTLATEAIRGEGGILLNSKGERFMKNYYPKRMELGPRDIVARAEEAKLKNALSRILKLKEEFYFKDNNLQEYKIDNDNGENIVSTWQVKSSLIVCEAIIRSALM